MKCEKCKYWASKFDEANPDVRLCKKLCQQAMDKYQLEEALLHPAKPCILVDADKPECHTSRTFYCAYYEQQ